MKTVREIYRQLNNDNQIPEIDGEGSFSVEQMIWFGEQVVKLCTIPPVSKPKGTVCECVEPDIFESSQIGYGICLNCGKKVEQTDC